jgi:putative transposase
MSFTPYDPQAGPIIYHRNLPHWRQPGTTYFVTFRLADSLPASRSIQLKQEQQQWLIDHDIHNMETLAKVRNDLRWQYAKTFNARWHELLDAGHGSCILSEPEKRQIVVDALQHWHGTRLHLDETVIMPNHVHTLITPEPDWSLSECLHSIKRFTARAINKWLDRKGALWQDESFDHIVRSEAQLNHFRDYIRQNPIKAHLNPTQFWLSPPEK